MTGGCGTAATGTSPPALRLGYLPNLTHAPALIAVARGRVAQRLGPGASLTLQRFNAGPACMIALLAGSVDACYIGPSPAINAFVKSQGEAVRIVAGATSGGAGLVVRRDAHISAVADLRGRTLATPQLGNTQDVALRAFLKAHGLATDPLSGGDVKIVPSDNSTILQLFKQGSIDGAWVPEPYLSWLELQSGGTLLVDEATLWPHGLFATTNLVVATPYLAAHRDVVRDLIEAEADAIAFAENSRADAKAVVNSELARLAQAPLSSPVLDRAWSRLTFSLDPNAGSLRKSASDAQAAGLLPAGARLDGIYDLTVVNEVLRERGSPTVSAAGIGRE